MVPNIQSRLKYDVNVTNVSLIEIRNECANVRKINRQFKLDNIVFGNVSGFVEKPLLKFTEFCISNVNVRRISTLFMIEHTDRCESVLMCEHDGQKGNTTRTAFYQILQMYC